MKLLLDTHVALWAVTGDERLSRRARDLVGDPDNEVFVSVVSIWEIAIKHVVKPQDMPISAERALEAFIAAAYAMLPVQASHAVAVGALPRHHGDPFDRMLVAQAKTEPLRLVTRDRTLAAYGDIVLMV